MSRSLRTASPLDLSAYPALNFEGLHLRANYRLIAFREDILHALDRREAAAIIIQILLRWQEYLRDALLEQMESRRREKLPPLTNEEMEERLWAYMSYARFVRESDGALSYNTVIRTLEYLIAEKQVVERRANPHPHTDASADYEYRINRSALRELLRKVPLYPPRTSAKTAGTSKGKPAQPGPQGPVASERDLRGEAPTSTQIGIPPHMGRSSSTHMSTPPHMGRPASTHVSTPPPQMDRPSAHIGTADYPCEQTIHSFLQDSLQESLQQQRAGNPTPKPQATAAVLALPLASFAEPPSPTDLPLPPQHQIPPLSHPLPSALASAPPSVSTERPSPPPCNIEQAERQAQSSAPPAKASASLAFQHGDQPHPASTPASAEESWPIPPSAEALSAETMLALVERLLGRPYDAVARTRQHCAAREILALGVLPDLATLERIYHTCYDEWWKQHYGELHLTHLIEREASGEVRIIRLLTRLSSASHAPAAASPRTKQGARAGTTNPAWSSTAAPDLHEYAEQRRRAATEELLRNGDSYLEDLRQWCPQEAEQFAAALHLMRQRVPQIGGTPCNR